MLRYAHQLEAQGKPVTAVLAVESRPSDASWMTLCERLGVVLACAAAFEDRL